MVDSKNNLCGNWLKYEIIIIIIKKKIHSEVCKEDSVDKWLEIS